MTLCRADVPFILASILGPELQAGEAGGMSVEFRQPEGLHGQSPGPGGHSRATDTGPPSMPTPWSLPRWRAYVAAAVLCYINLLNYMNWFIIAGETGAGQAGQQLPAAGAVCPQWASIQRTFFLCGASLLFLPPPPPPPPQWFQASLNGERTKRVPSVCPD